MVWEGELSSLGCDDKCRDCPLGGASCFYKAEKIRGPAKSLPEPPPNKL